MKYATVDARISPIGRLDVLSQAEVGKLLDSSQGGLGRSVSGQDSELRQISVKVDCLDCGGAEPGSSKFPFRYKQ